MDTFEFHCCYGADGVEADSLVIFNRLQQLAEDLCVPVIWSTRPPWSNNAQVSISTIGGDTPLLSGATLQVGTLYNQGTVFSSAFGIRYRNRELMSQPTFHLAGAVSRRLLLAHLFASLKTDRSFFPHPCVNPCQIELLFRPSDDDSLPSAEQLVATLASHGVRVRLKPCSSSEKVKQAFVSKGILLPCLTVLLLGRRHKADTIRLVIRRNDDSSEVLGTATDLPSVSIEMLLDAFHDVKGAYRWRRDKYLSSRVRREDNLSRVRERITERAVVCAPMCFSEESVAAVAEWKAGEVMGFVDSGFEQCCVISGRPCTTEAYMSPRA